MTPARPDRAFIPARYYLTLLYLLEERGHDTERLLAPAEISRVALSGEEAFLSLAQVEALVERACRLENTDQLGLMVGERLQLMSHGELSVAALTAQTVAEALDLVVECFALLMPLFHLELIPLGETIAIRLSVRWPLDPEVERFHTAMLSGSLHAQLGLLLKGVIPEGVELDARHPRPEGLPAWVDEMSVKLGFDQPTYELRIPEALLRVGLPLADRSTHEPARRRCLAALESRPDPSRQSSAVDRLLRELGPPYPDLDAVSRILGLSSRSLRRKLKEEGTSFRARLEHVRIALAERWLADSSRSITEIALELGYADAANFTRAFRRARGISPSAARAVNAAS